MANVSATLLSWIKNEIDHAFKVVRDSIDKFSAAPEDATVLRVCPDQLHQVSGALRIIGLSGATRFCEAIEGGFSGLSGGKPSKATIGVIDRSVLALKEFVDDLMRGQANVPLRLFPMYRELTTLQGKSDISEKDLFFPDLTLPAPPHTNPKTLTEQELAPFLQSQRARFQRGCLAWLRNQPSGLQDMRQALDALHQIAPQLPEPRALWWVAVGLIDGLLDAPEPDWHANTKALYSKLDFQIRDLAAGSQKSNEPLLRELLFAMAKCKPATARIRDIKQLYQLDILFPEPDLPGLMEFDMDWLQPALIDVHSRLEALKDTWQQYISGEPKSISRFREQVASFKAKAVELGNPQLIKLLDVIALVAATRLPDPYPQQGQFMVIEMASAFLLIANVVDNFTNPPADLEGQIVIMGGWLLDATKGESSGKLPTGLRADLTQQIGILQLRAQVAKEILTNLQHVEQVLDAFARDPAKRDTLKGLQPYLRQIQGALSVLGFNPALEVTSMCALMIAECAKEDYAAASEDVDWIAEGLSTLGFYLDPCLRGREPTNEAISVFFSRIEKRRAPPPPDTVKDVPTIIMAASLASAEPDAAAPPVDVDTAATPEPAEAVAVITPTPEPVKVEAPQAPAAASQTAVNEELLEIFLFEANEVLANIEGSLKLCGEQPNNREALVTIRRGFHTLKGSGRMVGLTDLGEVAWEIEQVMNRWLEQQQPASPHLLELISGASTAFTGWVAQLQAGKSPAVAVEAQRIVDFARRLKAGEEPAGPLVEPATKETATPAPAPQPAAPTPEPDELMIGSVRLDRSLFDIYANEAAEHVAVLEAEFNGWRTTPGAEASHDFLRAAHTLASSSGTAGFTAIADLAGALEQWIPVARQVTQPRDAELVKTAIATLREMTGAIAQRQLPAPAEEAARGLHDLTGRMLAAPPPPVESAQTALTPVDVPIAAPPESAEAFDLTFTPPPPAESTLPASPVGIDVPIATPFPPTAEPAPAASTGAELRKIHDDIDDQLLLIFLEEAQQLLPLIGSDLRDWKANPGDEKVLQSLQRALHTLKGSARMAGAIRLGELTHIMESLIEAATEANRFSPELFEELESKMDRLSLDLDRMQSDQAAPKTAPAAPAAAAPLDEVPRQAAPPRVEPPLPSPAAVLRINADTLDHLINESGEVSIARSRVETELRGVKQSLGELKDSVDRLRNQLREVEIQADSQMQSRLSVMEERKGEFDPLEFDRYTRLQELTRMMIEGLHDVTAIQQTLLKNLGESDAALLQQARISREVQQELMRMRAVPFSNLNERLYRIVRQTARELDKKAELEIEGSQVELDRSVLEKIGAPLEHLLRNALGHGLESPASRVAAGKPETGRITIALQQESNEIALTLSDDGAGLDLESLRRTAVEKGLLQRDHDATEAELVQLIFASGLSTTKTVTELSGRGIGMDVVRNEISSIGGRIDIVTARGKGTTFTIYLPLTLAVTQTVLVRAGETVLAISSAMIEQVLRLKADEMTNLYSSNVVEFQDRSYPLHYFRHLLGSAGATNIQNYNSVLLLRSGMHRIAVHVDELIGNQEIVVKNIGPQLSRVPGVAGATVLADGGIVLIINPVLLAQRAGAAPVKAVTPQPAVAESSAPVIMVVDDSLTVRKITSRLLEREGYHVLTAKDGIDALEQMEKTLPAVMLVDIEMPRMDGFDLTKQVRSDPRTRGVPIIIISSRTAEKHRNHAVELGVNVFLGKPYPEAELLQHVATYVGAGQKTTLQLSRRFHGDQGLGAF
jgi:chemosensory pili system protein ChpA (sensor histidine kinase/response regulator)